MATQLVENLTEAFDPTQYQDEYKANLKKFVENGGTLLVVGSAVETARDLLDLPIERALPAAAPRFGQGGQGAPGAAATQGTANADAVSAATRCAWA